MPRRRPSPAAPLRGMAAGSLTAALALTAHSLASGAAPAGAGAAMLGVLAATVGAVAATADRASDARVLLALLAGGQLIAHIFLAITAHHAGHHFTGLSAGHSAGLSAGHFAGLSAIAPSAAMLAAHTIALIVGAALIAGGDRLCHAICAAVRDATPRISCPIGATKATATAPAVGGDQPPRSALLLAASMSHRGPPAGRAR